MGLPELSTGLPKSYGDVLTRIAIVTSAVAAFSAWVLVRNSEVLQGLLQRASLTMSLPRLTPATMSFSSAVIVGFVVALIFRASYMHDVISSVLGIRRDFDVVHILTPLALGAGLEVDTPMLQTNRDNLMKRTFYKYVGDDQVAISQLVVSKALDGWAWFWCAVECTMVLLVAAGISLIVKEWQLFGWFVGAVVFMAVLAMAFQLRLPKLAHKQVEEILDDPGRKKAVERAFRRAV